MKPFKQRSIDISKSVRIYRNLHSKKTDEAYSVLQNKLVVAHTGDLVLENCKFIISKKGQDMVRKRKRKLVHAYIEGFICREENAKHMNSKITYNPYANDTFMCDGKPVFNKNNVKIENFSVFAE